MFLFSFIIIYPSKVNGISCPSDANPNNCLNNCDDSKCIVSQNPITKTQYCYCGASAGTTIDEFGVIIPSIVPS